MPFYKDYFSSKIQWQSLQNPSHPCKRKEKWRNLTLSLTLNFFLPRDLQLSLEGKSHSSNHAFANESSLPFIELLLKHFTIKYY
jgi:hypothetical protein